MYGAVVERGKILAADEKKYIVETLDRKGIESLQITALNGAPFAVGDIVYFFLFSDGTGKILCSESSEDATGFVVDKDYVHTDNNFTNEEKKKLADIEADAQKNVQSDWNAASGDAFIKNKPIIPTKVSELTNDSHFINSDSIPTKVSELENDSGFVNAAEAAAAAPIQSVNGKTGPVKLNAADVGALGKDVILMPDTAFAIPAEGASVSYSMDGFTKDHMLVLWNFSSSAENQPPVDLRWDAYDGYFTITNEDDTTSESIQPVFVLPTAKAIIAR